MNKFSKNKILQFFCLWIFLPTTLSQAGSPLSVIVGVSPYAYLAERIGGEHLKVHVLIGQGQDPHTFEPSPKQVMSLGSGKIFFFAGLEFEQHLIAKIRGNYTGLQVVDLRTENVPSEGRSGHADEGGSQETEHDPHIWLSPKRLQLQAEKMTKALSEIDPEHRQEYHENLAEFISDLVKVRERITERLIPFKGRTFLVFHPAFSHFGDDFGLIQKAVEAGGKRPSPKQIAVLISTAKREEVKIIFVQPQFDRASAELIASAIGGVVVSMDPLAKDVLGNFEEIAEKLERSFQ
jgi:zinc transport system substrate-binding protein